MTDRHIRNNNQHLTATPESEEIAEQEARRKVYEDWVQSGQEGQVVMAAYYRPNGGQATWTREIAVDELDIDPDEWETIDREDSQVTLFRHDGPVLHHMSLRWEYADKVPAKIVDAFTGGCTLDFNNLPRFADWLEEEMNLETDSTEYAKVLVYALRLVANQMDAEW